ncbi:MAG: sugar ABC transporter ATP-binding protein [Synergistaceae bacterium]|jgi:ribose transport system ATP-binding protein|nr:sugar ABC transporter ATP-binding protein [Synergistaceae bacterium]
MKNGLNEREFLPRLLFKGRNLSKTYGGNTVLRNIDIDIYRGEIAGLVGENGAGKSTLLKIISGVEPPSTGEMEMNGSPYKCSSILDAHRRGVGMVFQEQSLTANLTVAQNIYRGRESRFSVLGLVRWGKMNAAAQKVMAAVDIRDIPPDRKVWNIPFAARQRVEIAKVLDIVSNATEDRSLILLDEPTTVLSREEMESLFREVRKMAGRGNGVIFVSHRLSEVLELTDRIYVFKDGEKTAVLKTSEASEDILYEKMVGRETTGEYYLSARQALPSDDVVLETEALSQWGVFIHVSFKLRRGEVLGICGVEGSGKEAVCSVLCGDESATGGTIRVNGEKRTFVSPKDALDAGILSVPRNRREDGILGMLSIRENITLSSLKKLASHGVVSLKKQNEEALSWVTRLGIKCSGIFQRISNLSGGNAQKAIFARVLGSDCPILVLDHPTRGVDVGSKGEIYSLIREITKRGVSVVLLGDTLDECIGLASRILVMKDGIVTGEFDCSHGRKPSQVEVVQKMM